MRQRYKKRTLTTDVILYKNCQISFLLYYLFTFLAGTASHEVEEIYPVTVLELNLLIVFFLSEVLVHLDGNHLWLEHLINPQIRNL